MLKNVFQVIFLVKYPKPKKLTNDDLSKLKKFVTEIFIKVS